jgi:glutaredoxin
MKYLITMLVLFSAPTYAQVLNSNNQSEFTHQNPSSQINQEQKKRVTMYSTTLCHFCRDARQYFSANKIPYLELNIEKSSAALQQFKAMKAFGTPTIVMGEKKLIGFNVARFQNFYGDGLQNR